MKTKTKKGIYKSCEEKTEKIPNNTKK